LYGCRERERKGGIEGEKKRQGEREREKATEK